MKLFLSQESEAFFKTKIKEVIQPHVPVRLPCYDLTLLANLWFKSLNASFTKSSLGWFDGRCVQGAGTYSAKDSTKANAS